MEKYVKTSGNFWEKKMHSVGEFLQEACDSCRGDVYNSVMLQVSVSVINAGATFDRQHIVWSGLIYLNL